VTLPFVTRAPIALSALIERVAAPERGAIASFLGTVRAGPDDGPVTRIEYSAYEPMLEKEFARIVGEVADRWSGATAAAQHRLGNVPLGEASIAVAVAAPHRDAALDACRFVIEEAKRRLPVWKREILADGSAAWRDNSGGRVAAAPPGEPR
jgi:molybdopterin synthase catalytic subunit